nr:MAG: hypothetical protein [Podoviridae sp. ctka020]
MNEHLKEIGMNLLRHVEEFACAFYQKTKVDPRKVVMIQHTDLATGKIYTWFEKKRGRSRKEILNNVKSHAK